MKVFILRLALSINVRHKMEYTQYYSILHQYIQQGEERLRQIGICKGIKPSGYTCGEE